MRGNEPAARSDNVDDPATYRALVRLLLAYRWASLAVPLVQLFALRLHPNFNTSHVLLLGLTLGINLVLSLGHRWLDQAVRQRPWLLGVDLGFMAGVLALTGGEQSPYILHSFSPVFAAALFFRLRGAAVTAALYALLLAGAGAWAAASRGRSPDLAALVTYGLGVTLVGLLVGYVSALLQRTQVQARRLAAVTRALSESNRELQRAHDQLHLLRSLALGLESATDPVELLERLVEGLVDTLHFRRAVAALYDMETDALTGWLARGGDGTIHNGHALQLPMHLGEEAPRAGMGGVLAQAMQRQSPVVVDDGRSPSGDPEIDAMLGLAECYMVLPLFLRGQPVGILVVDLSCRESLSPEEHSLLEQLALHASISLGSLRLCVGRTRQTAVEAERSRIASDIHDTVSQSLFGLAYGLSACTDMLPDEPEQVALVKRHLQNLQPMVLDALQQVRRVILDILPGDLSRERFVRTLRKQFQALTLNQPVRFEVEVSPRFNRWPLEFRQQLLLMAHECVVNAARHAQASYVQVTLQDDSQHILLTVVDNGTGFDPVQANLLPGLGLEGIRERAEALGGQVSVESNPGQGTTLRIRLPQPYRHRAMAC